MTSSLLHSWPYCFWHRVLWFAVVWLYWLVSELSGAIPSPVTEHIYKYSHAWIFMWTRDIQTQNLMLIEQVLLPTESSPQPQWKLLKRLLIRTPYAQRSSKDSFSQTQLAPPELIISSQLFLMIFSSSSISRWMARPPHPWHARCSLSSGWISTSLHSLPFVLWFLPHHTLPSAVVALHSLSLLHADVSHSQRPCGDRAQPFS